MTKALGLTLALSLALVLTAAAEEKKGTVRSIDTADKSIVLEDGTKLSVSTDQIADMAPGDKVFATYKMQGGKNVVVALERRTGDPGDTTNFASRTAPPEEFEAD